MERRVARPWCGARCGLGVSMSARRCALLVALAFAGCTTDLVFDLADPAMPRAEDAGAARDASEADAAGPIVPTGPIGPTGEWQMTFREECAAPLDAQRVNTFLLAEDGLPVRTWNLRAEYVSDEQVSVSGGECRITAEPIAMGDREYTSGAISTGGLFAQHQGYFEARVWVPIGAGLWTMWFLRDAQSRWPPAIEIFNISGSSVSGGNAHFTTQYYDPDQNQHGAQIDVAEAFEGFHVAGVEWTDTELIFYFDGVERSRFTTDVEKLTMPMYPAINLSVHTGELDDPPPDATTPWPGVLRIDWIRVWQKE